MLESTHDVDRAIHELAEMVAAAYFEDAEPGSVTETLFQGIVVDAQDRVKELVDDILRDD